ncbi:MAG: hypothetical protein Q8O76_12920 [Chloroflexota bacterium]|nr:hypothetical protein [Chloroflexota bacterium]
MTTDSHLTGVCVSQPAMTTPSLCILGSVNPGAATRKVEALAESYLDGIQRF